MLKYFFSVVFFAITNITFSQLFINELSQGNGGSNSDEYIELIVVGTKTCSDSTANIQNWILDDNNGFYATGSGSGIAGGHIRFNSDPQWANVPYGSIILVYNGSNVFPGIVIDETDANNDKVYVLPSTSSFFEADQNLPAGGGAITTYAGATYTAGGMSWSGVNMRNGGDAIHTITPTALDTAYHSVCWDDNSGANIYFSNSASGLLFQNENLVDNNPYLQANWTSQGQASGTPGAGNNAANIAWINSMQAPAPTADFDTINQIICDGDSFLFNTNYYSISGLYTDTFTTASCDSIVTLNLSLEICLSCEMDLGNDTLICGPVNYTLDAGTFDEYLWQDGSTNQTFTATASGQYYCQATNFDPTNLIVNPDFESGNVNFTTDYTVGTGGAFGQITNPGTYAINTSPSNVHNNFPFCADHTSGAGNMMIVNGSNTPNQAVWCQTINVDPNTDYYFSIWATSVENTNTTNVSSLFFELNGTQIGTNFSPSFNACDWQQYTETWNSGVNTSVDLCIYNHTITGNNDFAIDDIFFGEACIASDTINILDQTNLVDSAVVDVCFGESAVIFGNTETVEALYLDTIKTLAGCDSLYIKRYLEVGDSLFFNKDTAICFGDSAFLQNAWQNTANTYFDTLMSVNMCDSLIVTNLAVRNAPTTDTTFSCTNIMANAGINIVDTTFNNIGCDSVYNYSNVMFSPTDSSYTLSCTNNAAMAGLTRDTALNTMACDSFYTITETRYYAPTSTTLIDSCTNIAANAQNQTDTISTALGCDSVYQVSIVRYINPVTNTLPDSCTNVASQATTIITNISSVKGCDSITLVQELVYINPVNEAPIRIEICEGETLEIFGNTENSAGTYTQNIMSNGACDSITRTTILVVNPLPTINAGNDTTINLGENATLNATGGNTYTWSNGETGSIITVSPENTTGYQVTALDTNNCTGSDSVTVFLLFEEIELFMPTAFSPNGDGLNDVFRIINQDDFEKITLRVYNRWGERVFNSTAFITEWDGTYKGKDQPIDNFVYYLEATAKANKKQFKISGSITIIR